MRLSVQDATRRLLRLQVATGPVYYLRLRPEHPDAVFRLWGRLAAILRHGLSITCKDPAVRLSHSLVPSPAGSSSSSEVRCLRQGEWGERARVEPGRWQLGQAWPESPSIMVPPWSPPLGHGGQEGTSQPFPAAGT